MIIKTILNNSALISRDTTNNDIVLVGKGISFGKHPGDDVDESKIEQIFKHEDGSDEIIEMLSEVPSEYFEVTNLILRYATRKLNSPLKKRIYITLADHIFSSVERYGLKQQLNFSFLDDLKELYPEIYRISEWTLDYINAEFEVELWEDEIGFLAIHFINALTDEQSLTNVKQVMKFLHALTNILKSDFSEDYKLEGMNYSRFVTHLKYLALRYQKKEQITNDEVLRLNLENTHKKIIDSTITIMNQTVKTQFGSELSQDEVNYLRLHLARLIK